MTCVHWWKLSSFPPKENRLHTRTRWDWSPCFGVFLAASLKLICELWIDSIHELGQLWVSVGKIQKRRGESYLQMIGFRGLGESQCESECCAQLYHEIKSDPFKKMYIWEILINRGWHRSLGWIKTNEWPSLVSVGNTELAWWLSQSNKLGLYLITVYVWFPGSC